MLYDNSFVRTLVGTIAALSKGINITPNGSAVALSECKDAFYGTLANADVQFTLPNSNKSLVLGDLAEKSIYVATDRKTAENAIVPLVANCDVKDVVEIATCKLGGKPEDYALVCIAMVDTATDADVETAVMTIVTDHFGYTAPTPATGAAAAAAANTAPTPPMGSNRP